MSYVTVRVTTVRAPVPGKLHYDYGQQNQKPPGILKLQRVIGSLGPLPEDDPNKQPARSMVLNRF